MNGTPQSTHHERNPQTHRTARTQNSFFLFSFFFVVCFYRRDILVVVAPPSGCESSSCSFFLPGAPVWRRRRAPPLGGGGGSSGGGVGDSPIARLVSSAMIYYLSISQCGRKERIVIKKMEVQTGRRLVREVGGVGWSGRGRNQENHIKKKT